MNHSKVQPFLAYKNGNIAGRITAHENNNHVAYHHEKIGFFGFFECIDDQDVANELFNAAAKWLKDRGLTAMRGPASFSVNGDPIGLLVDGFDSTPIVGMVYNPKYYISLFEKAGLLKSQDLFAYRFDITKKGSEKLKGIVARALKDPKLTIRTARKKDIKKELDKLKFIYNEALANNWGAVPMTEDEFEHFSGELKLAVDEDMTHIAEYDGKPVGLSLVFRNFNEALQSARGRLFPFGLIKILLKQKKISWVRVPVLGVLEPYRNRGIDIIFYSRMMEIGFKKGYQFGELSYILESNSNMNSIIQRLGSDIYKTYRLYDRAL